MANVMFTCGRKLLSSLSPRSANSDQSTAGSCGGSVGIYFLIKKNSILYLYSDKGTFSTPPYLDAHGEVDLGGRFVFFLLDNVFHFSYLHIRGIFMILAFSSRVL
jgi:hypothetical protein